MRATLTDCVAKDALLGLAQHIKEPGHAGMKGMTHRQLNAMLLLIFHHGEDGLVQRAALGCLGYSAIGCITTPVEVDHPLKINKMLCAWGERRGLTGMCSLRALDKLDRFRNRMYALGTKLWEDQDHLKFAPPIKHLQVPHALRLQVCELVWEGLCDGDVLAMYLLYRCMVWGGPVIPFCGESRMDVLRVIEHHTRESKDPMVVPLHDACLQAITKTEGRVSAENMLEMVEKEGNEVALAEMYNCPGLAIVGASALDFVKPMDVACDMLNRGSQAAVYFFITSPCTKIFAALGGEDVLNRATLIGALQSTHAGFVTFLRYHITHAQELGRTQTMDYITHLHGGGEIGGGRVHALDIHTITKNVFRTEIQNRGIQESDVRYLVFKERGHPGNEGSACLFCHDDIENGQSVVACNACGRGVHSACFGEYHKSSVLHGHAHKCLTCNMPAVFTRHEFCKFYEHEFGCATESTLRPFRWWLKCSPPQ